MSALLTVADLHVRYGVVPAVSGVSLELPEGSIRVILGANGAGKSTVTRAILGLVPAHEGSIRFGGVDLLGMPTHKIHRLGIAWVPQGRQVWGSMTVLENLLVGAGDLRGTERHARLEEMYQRFPRLRERQRQLAGSMSGGEQQQVAIARALISRPKMVIMDEPTLGLAPKIIADLFTLVEDIRRSGVSVLMIEQNARQALKVADWGYVLDGGRLALEGPARDLAENDGVRAIYLGGRA